MVISDRQMGHPRACCSNWATHDAQNRRCLHGTNASRASRCSMRQTSHISCVHKNTVGGEIWCSSLSTHAFLLGNGQTYATRGVPYYRVSRIFTSRIFHPCNLVPLIHVSHFSPLQHGAAFSCPAISCIAFSASPVEIAHFTVV